MIANSHALEQPPRLVSVRILLLACAVGLVVGFGAFLLTSQDAGPPVISWCLPAAQPGFDPLTGMPHGASFNCPQLTGLGGQISVPQDVPMVANLAARRAIPVPVGVLAGAALSLLGGALVSAWRRRST
ncbi:MAG: hypothetical protein ACRDGQ_10130 [Candidatus Limnocylindrales bacterium]